MADFVEISKDDRWADKWGGVLIRDELDFERAYYGHQPTHPDAPELKQLAAVQSVAPKSESAQAKHDDGAFAPALMWPVHAVKSQSAAPFVAAGVAGLLLVPMFVPAINLTATLLSGYVAGGATYYVQNTPRDNDSHKELGDVERYVAVRNTDVSSVKAGVIVSYFFAFFVTRE